MKIKCCPISTGVRNYQVLYEIPLYISISGVFLQSCMVQSKGRAAFILLFVICCVIASIGRFYSRELLSSILRTWFCIYLSQLRVTPLKPSANEKRQCYTRGLCGLENAADGKGPGQNGEREIEADTAAYLMRTEMGGEKQDKVAAGEHKRAPEEVFPTKVSRSLITKKGQSSDAQKTPTEEAVDEASPLDYKQSDEARPKTSENKRVCMMRTVVKLVQGKRLSGKGVWSRKVNKNLKGSPQTLSSH